MRKYILPNSTITGKARLSGCAFGLALMTTLLLTACEIPNLTPAPSAEQPPGEPEAAVAEVGGIDIRVESNSWHGDATVIHELTPIHLRIDNNSGVPVRLRYREFALTGPQGQYYAALPPLAARVDVDAVDPAPLPAGYDPLVVPSFHQQRFFIAPPYKYAYETLPVWERDFHYDAFYHDIHHTSYMMLDIPAEELQAQALPEGVLADGGVIDGYLYFEHVDVELPQVYFRADFVNADTGKTFGTATIPFTVDDS